jgi:peptidyl-prolyl cis-trans isomerase C
MYARRVLIFIVAACMVGLVSSCAKEKKGQLKITKGLAARVGNVKISEEEMLKRFEMIPPQQLREFRGRDGQAKFTDKLIEEQLLYQEALAEKLNEAPEVKEDLKYAEINILVAQYYRRKIASAVKISDKEIEEYYTTHSDEFLGSPVMRAQYLFSTDSLKAAKWKARLAKGESFTKIAKTESEDEATAPVGGDLGYFNPGGYIKSIGLSDKFSNAVLALEQNKVSDVIHFEKGYAIVRVIEKNPAKAKSLADVKGLIQEKLEAMKRAEAYTSEVERLKKKYAPENYVRENLEKTTRTPEELWEIAQMETDPRKRIEYYRQLVFLYPDHANAPQALFMIGFVYSEELKDFVQARRTFNELIGKYPQSDIIPSAQWMMENMGKSGQKLEPENVKKSAMEEQEKKATGKE